LVAVAPAAWNWVTKASERHDPLPGYIAESGKLEEEYSMFTGKPLDPAATSQFDQATGLMLAGKYSSAVIVLEAAAKEIPVPAVFNDLGVLYMKLKDGPHALKAFRDALARNHDYAPVRANLKSMNLTGPIDPGANELEPNDDNSQANAVWVDRPVDATISPSTGDVDCYWFTTPRPPRDRISIAVIARSVTLTPRLRAYDETGKMVTGLKEGARPGDSVRFDFSPPPNSLYYVQVDGASGSSGAYTLAVNALKAYDVYEPNDTILTATRIVLGQTIDANIMDADDTDFFSFLSPVAAAVNIDLVSGNSTLVLGLTTFAPDLRNLGFAPDPEGPGGSIHYAMQLEANQLYYVQVFSRTDTTGPYSCPLSCLRSGLGSACGRTGRRCSPAPPECLTGLGKVAK
jgi:tetratricopeptide (TPR) repeat protein